LTNVDIAGRREWPYAWWGVVRAAAKGLAMKLDRIEAFVLSALALTFGLVGLAAAWTPF